MIFAFRVTISSEPEQLPSVEPKFGEARFSCPSTNSGSVYLSGSPVDSENITLRYAIAAGQHFPLKIDNLSEIYVYGTTDDVLDVICQVKKDYEEVIKQIKAKTETKA